MVIKRFTEIRAWQAAREMVKAIYVLCERGALAKDFVMRDQLRRAAISTMSNIAEGFSRGSDRDFTRFLDIARASANEVESLLFICLDVGHISQADFDLLHDHTTKTLSLTARFQDYLRNPALKESEEGYEA